MGRAIDMTHTRPHTVFNIVGGEPSFTPQRLLLVGQQLEGAATPGELVTRIEPDGDDLFGSRSPLAAMIRTVRKYNGETRIDAIGIADDAEGCPATGGITLSGVAEEDGVISLTIGSATDHQREFDIPKGWTSRQAAERISVIGLDIYAPFCVNSVSWSKPVKDNTVKLVAKNYGTIGNDIGIRVTNTTPGLEVSVTGFSGGAGDPDLTWILDVIGEERYQTIVWQPTWDLSPVVNLLDERFHDADNILDGVAVVSKTDSLENLMALGRYWNSQSLVVFGNERVVDGDYQGSSLFEFDYNIAATVGALRALRLTDEAPIADIVTVRGAKDAFGGPASASLPYFNTRARHLSLIDTGRGFIEAEIRDLNDAGISIIGNNRSRTDVVLGELVTTYKADGAGNADTSFKYLNSVDTLSIIREIYVGTLKSRFAQARLTAGTIVPGRNMANKVIIEGELDRIYNMLSGPDFGLTQSGPEALRFFKDNRDVIIDLDAESVTVTAAVPVVVQLRQITGVLKLQFSFSLKGESAA